MYRSGVRGERGRGLGKGGGWRDWRSLLLLLLLKSVAGRRLLIVAYEPRCVFERTKWEFFFFPFLLLAVVKNEQLR